MDESVLNLCAISTIGPHLILALLSLVTDTRSWYDTTSALSILLPITVVAICYDLRFSSRGYVHMLCVLVGVVGAEVSRQSRSTDWNLLSPSEHLSFVLGIASMIKGVGTFIKLLPTIRSLMIVTNATITWRDYVGWTSSLLGSIYLLHEPNIYRNDEAVAEWKWIFTWAETIHWSGLALSASSYRKGHDWILLPLASLQPLLCYVLFHVSIKISLSK